MKRINRKTVETRLLFATTFSSLHPFVAFVLSENLGTRLMHAFGAKQCSCLIVEFVNVT